MTIQGQIFATIFCPPQSQATFIWNILLYIQK